MRKHITTAILFVSVFFSLASASSYEEFAISSIEIDIMLAKDDGTGWDWEPGEHDPILEAAKYTVSMATEGTIPPWATEDTIRLFTSGTQPPDSFFYIWKADSEAPLYTSGVIPDNYNPRWEDAFTINVPYDNDVILDFWDEDIAEHDDIAAYQITNYSLNMAIDDNEGTLDLGEYRGIARCTLRVKGLR